MTEPTSADALRHAASGPPASRSDLQRALDRLAGLRSMDALIIRRTPFPELSLVALRHLRSLVPAGRASVIGYNHAAGTGTILAVDEVRPAAVGPGTVFPLTAIVPAELLAVPETRVYPDMATQLADLAAVPRMLAAGYRAACWSPMIADGVLVGMLAMAAEEPAAFAGDAAEIAAEVAGQLAVAVRAERDREAASRASRRLALLHQVDRAILDAESMVDLARRMAGVVRELVVADRVVIARYEPGRGVGYRLASARTGEEAPEETLVRVPLDRLVSPAIVERPSTMIMRDLAAAADSAPGVRFMVEQGLLAGVFVPLVAHGAIQGGLIVGWRDQSLLTDEHVTIAGEVADQLAIAIQHADARERLERTNDHLALLHEIDLAILASESPEGLAGRVAGPLARLARARRLDISAYDLATDEGRVLAFAHDSSSQATPVGTVYPLRTSVPMARAEAPALMVFDDTRQLADDTPLVRSAVAAGLAHGMWIPLVAGGRLLGAIGMAGDDPLMTSPEIVELARAIGDQLAVALQHAEDRSQLAEREHRLAAILGASPNGILAVDAAGLINYANPAAHRLFRAPDGALVGLRHATLVPPDVADVHPVQVAEWFLDPDPATSHPLDTEAVRLDGTSFPVHVLLARVDTSTGPLGIATVVDLSERTALEGRLRQAERLETLGQFAGILAHDVRNYLTAVAWSAELLESEMAEDDPRTAELEMIRKATQDAIDMTRTVLEFARPTGDPTGVLDVAAHLSGTRSMLTRILGEGIRLEVAVDPGLPPAGINATALTQVLGNLASNARDAMPDGGSVTVTARLHEAHGAGPDAGALEPGRYVRLRVADTGVGMDEDTRRRAFDAFYTTKTMASTARGTGLGLSSVFLIVTKAGGSVHVDSVPGEGTTFTVDLPVVRRA